MAEDEIPPSILRRHPELRAVGQALEAIRDGRPVLARCPTCGNLLSVERASAEVLVVACGNGCTNFRARRSASA